MRAARQCAASPRPAGNVAIAPTVQHDAKKSVTTVIVPVYFLKAAKRSPIGGVRGNWRSDTHSVVLSLFVEVALQSPPSSPVAQRPRRERWECPIRRAVPSDIATLIHSSSHALGGNGSLAFALSQWTEHIRDPCTGDPGGLHSGVRSRIRRGPVLGRVARRSLYNRVSSLTSRRIHPAHRVDGGVPNARRTHVAKRRKGRKARALITGVVAGLAEAATEGLKGASRTLGVAVPGGKTADTVAKGDKAGEKGTKKNKKRKDKRNKKVRAKAAERGVIALARLANTARKRLAKLAAKLGPVTAKRNALLAELATLQEGITTTLSRFGKDEEDQKAVARPKKRKA